MVTMNKTELLQVITEAVTLMEAGRDGSNSWSQAVAQKLRAALGFLEKQPRSLEEKLAMLREGGWSVAVHNDYYLGGVSHTFWLFTHPSGKWAKGEGPTDAYALTEIHMKLWHMPPKST